jgi:uncharacterized protein YjbJ (UPF0337 family)
MRRRAMSSTTEKMKSVTNEVIGSVKQSVGKAVGNPSLEIEGVGQKLKGAAQASISNAKETIKNLVDKA